MGFARATSSAPRPSLAELSSRPDRPWPNPAGSDRFATGSLAIPTGIRIEALELSVQACDVLKASGMEFLDDLALLGAEELAALPNMDQKVLHEIIDALARGGQP
jgi:DNA-directed RNA polymerase alpha subunit